MSIGAAIETKTRAFVRVCANNWMAELAVFVALVVAYNFVRGTGGTAVSAAYAHAGRIVDAEGGLFDHLEVPLNTWIIRWPAIAVITCYLYALLHYAMTPVVLLVSRHKRGWYYWRGYWALVLASAFAVAIYALYPVAPPRLIPDLGISDVMRDFADYGWWGSAASAPRGIGDATNQFAAMPSMHCGWALWCGIQMWGFGSKLWRIPAVLYPSVMTFVVLATGNHFLLDAAGGAACVLLAYAVVIGVHRVVLSPGGHPAHAPAMSLPQQGVGSARVSAPDFLPVRSSTSTASSTHIRDAAKPQGSTGWVDHGCSSSENRSGSTRC